MTNSLHDARLHSVRGFDKTKEAEFCLGKTMNVDYIYMWNRTTWNGKSIPNHMIHMVRTFSFSPAFMQDVPILPARTKLVTAPTDINVELSWKNLWTHSVMEVMPRKGTEELSNDGTVTDHWFYLRIFLEDIRIWSLASCLHHSGKGHT